MSRKDNKMTRNQTIAVFKAFYFGCESMQAISRKTRIPREEVREILRGARECGLIKYSTQDYSETFIHVEKKKLGQYLRAKGMVK